VLAVRRPKNLWSIAVVILVGIYSLYFSWLTVGVHRGLGSSAYDFGLYDQGIWLLSRGNSPFVTLMGRNLFGDHSSFILLFIVPIFWLTSSTSVLFIIQSVALGIGAFPLYAYSRRALNSDAMAFVMAAAYLLHPAVGLTNVENFHPDAFLGVLMGIVWWSALEKRWNWYWVSVALALLVKEDVGLIVLPIGLWVALRRDARRGLWTILISLGTMLLMFFVVMRSFTGITFRNSWRIPFGGFSGLFRVAFRQPQELWKYLISDDRPTYLFQLLAPTAMAFVIAPSVALTGIGVVGANLLSTFWYQHQIGYHYSLVVVPSLMFGTAYGVSRLPAHTRKRVIAAVAVCSLAFGYWLSPLPAARSSVGQWSASNPAVIAAHELFLTIPDEAVVSAYHPLTAQLARRERIYSFPNPFQRSLYGPDVFAKGDRLPFADEVQFVMLPAVLDEAASEVWSKESSEFRVVGSNAWWIVYMRL
jgi:uncharacterized membrane protein